MCFDLPASKIMNTIEAAKKIYLDIKHENKRQVDFSKLLRSRHFKIFFIEFLIEEWKSDSYILLCLDKKHY